MRIVRYHPRAALGDGGITGSVRRWSAAAARAGAASVIAYDGGEPPAAEEGVEWVAVKHRGPQYGRIPIGLREVLANADLLVLHSGWSPHNAWAARVAHRAGVPYVLEPRGAYDPALMYRRRVAKWLWWHSLENREMRHAAAIHAFFPSETDQLERLGWQGPVIVAPNGVNVPDDVSWDGGTGGYMLWVGRYDPEHKGLESLLEALARLLPGRRPQVRLHGPDWHGGRMRVTQQVDALGLGPWVTVGDPVYGADKWDLLRRAAAFVYPSRWEAFGNSTAEAVAAGVPTLVSPYPLGRFLAERGGAVLAASTASGLAEGLMQVLSPSARAIAARGRDIVRENFAWDRVASLWLNQAQALT